MRLRSAWVPLALWCGLALAPAAVEAQVDPPARTLRLRYSFQPECFRATPTGPCDTPKSNQRLDLGPQIAIWLEADQSAFVTDLMVTNLTAVRGIGNRPGFWKFPSTWRFPYGKRKMALPIWAYKRGRLYDTVMMQDDGGDSGGEMGIGFHEAISSPDPYHCLSFMPSRWVFNSETVDAITCPTGVFNSSKGRLDPSQKTPYPPRNDLVDFLDRDCDVVWTNSSGQCPATMKSSTRYGDMNDLDLVAAATPVYGKTYTGVWNMPAALPDGEYFLLMEINKEFDTNDSHNYKSYVDPRLPDAGFTNNFGQPAVLFRVPIRLDRTQAQQSTTMDIAGYADWDGATGQIHAPDPTISDKPGSGRGRLLVIEQPSIAGGPPLRGRVHVMTEVEESLPRCHPSLVGTGEVGGLEIPAATVTATQATVQFLEAADSGKPVEQYEIRYRQGETMTEEEFRSAVPAENVEPSTPGMLRTFTLRDLKPITPYVVGVRAMGGCLGKGPLALRSFVTPMLEFKTLRGCFIATAAYGSAQEPRLAALRRLRDAARPKSPLAAAAVDAYERSSPPVAAVLRQSEVARALVRSLLAPVVDAVNPR